MADTIKPSEILKRLFVRHYPVITLFNILSCYGAYFIFPGENILLLLLITHISQIFFWLIIILALYSFNPENDNRRIVIIMGASLLGILISYIGLAFYLDFTPFNFFSSIMSAKFFLIMLLIAVICSGTVILAERSLIIEKNYREEKTGRLLSEKKLVEDQLNLLQAQIEPQFLFNTMESICNLFDSDPEKANTMQMYFIQYLRATLIKTRARITTIGQEIDLIQSYMNIFKVSMKERLEYVIDVDPQVKETHFPSLLIQPVVESFIKNGLEKNTEGGQISIFVKKREDMLHIKLAVTVRHLNVEKHIKHTLSNINERLESLFENKGIIKLENNQPIGTTVLIEVPYG